MNLSQAVARDSRDKRHTAAAARRTRAGRSVGAGLLRERGTVARRLPAEQSLRVGYRVPYAGGSAARLSACRYPAAARLGGVVRVGTVAADAGGDRIAAPGAAVERGSGGFYSRA